LKSTTWIFSLPRYDASLESAVGSDHETGGICGLKDPEVRQSEIGEVVPKSDLPGGNMNLVKDADNFRKCSEVGSLDRAFGLSQEIANFSQNVRCGDPRMSLG